MGPLWKIALRNTLRHRRRTIITAIVMTVGIGTFIFLDSMLAGMDRMAVDNMADFTTATIRIRPSGYGEDPTAAPLDMPLPSLDKAIEASAARGLAAAPRLRFIATVSNYADAIPVVAYGVDPARDGKVFRTAASVSSGAWLGAGPAQGGLPRKEVVLGAELAGELKLAPGDSVVIETQTAHDATNADEYTVSGLVTTAAPEVNRSGVFLDIAEAQALVDSPGLVTELDMRPMKARSGSLEAGLASADSDAAALRMAIPGVRVDPLRYLVKDYLAMRAMKAKYSYVIILVILLIAAVGIVNTILMSVYSRVREIGVLRAYGLSSANVRRLFTIEGLMLGFVGSCLGVAFGALLDAFMVGVGIPLDALLGKMDFGSIALSGTLYGEWNPASMAFGFLFGMAISLIASLIPAGKAAKLEPIEALRFV